MHDITYSLLLFAEVQKKPKQVLRLPRVPIWATYLKCLVNSINPKILGWDSYFGGISNVEVKQEANKRMHMF